MMPITNLISVLFGAEMQAFLIAVVPFLAEVCA
jgi:hypothetical protein